MTHPIVQRKPIINYSKLREAAHARFRKMQVNPNEGKKVVRIRAKIIEDYYKEVETLVEPVSFKFYSDEGEESGGMRRAARPLQYFLAGLALCELSFYARNASIMRVDLESIEVEVEGQMDWNDRMRVLKYVGEKNELAERVRPGFHRIVETVNIRSKEKEDKIRKLVETVHENCTAYNTITNPTPIDSIVTLNDATL